MERGPVIAVAVGFEIPEAALGDLGSIAPGVEVHHVPYVESDELRTCRAENGGRNVVGYPTPEIEPEARAVWAEADIAIVWDLPDRIAELAPRLGWIQTINAGTDKFDLAALGAAGITLTNASGVGSASIAEFVMARVLQIRKDLRRLDAQQERREWKVRHGAEVAGSTMGIVGLGAIGRQVAKRARAFEMEVLATRSSALPGDIDPDVDELLPAVDLDRMLARSDVVVAALPHTADTEDLFDADRFAAMAPGAVFCNVGRGASVVEVDLIEALTSCSLGAAVLDVTRVEPLPAGDPLWDAPRLYLSPHSSVSVDRYIDRVAELFAANLRRHMAGEPLINTC